jgi:hypothetical protein
MFGTVTSGMITDQLKTQFDISLEKRKIHLEAPIRTLGDHEIVLRLHPDVTSTLKVRVESTTPPPAVAVAPAGSAEGRKEEQRTEKRWRRPEGAGEKGAKAEAPRAEAGDRKARPAKAPKTDKGAKP